MVSSREVPASRTRKLLAVGIDFILFSATWGVVVYFARVSFPALAKSSLYVRLAIFGVIELLVYQRWSWSPGHQFLGIRFLSEAQGIIGPSFFFTPRRIGRVVPFEESSLPPTAPPLRDAPTTYSQLTAQHIGSLFVMDGRHCSIGAVGCAVQEATRGHREGSLDVEGSEGKTLRLEALCVFS
jgi:hypothetical protein